MSIFSHIRRSRQQARQHNAKVAEEQKKAQQQPHTPYKHVPTHAAIDAFACAPPSWRKADRPRILAENRRRSAMAAAHGQHYNMAGVPRVASSLSHVTYPSEDATPVVHFPRACSYSGMPSCADAGLEPTCSISPAPSSYSHPVSLKGKEVARDGLRYDIDHLCPPAGKAERDMFHGASSSASISSQDDLDMMASRSAMIHRLHPSRPRRTSDSSLERHALANSAKAPACRDSRPPPSMRGFASISQMIPPQPLQMPNRHSRAGGLSTPVTAISRQSSSASLPDLTPASSRAAMSAPVTPIMAAALQNLLPPAQVVALDDAPCAEMSETAYAPVPSRCEIKRSSRPTSLHAPTETASVAIKSQNRHKDDNPRARQELANVLPESISLTHLDMSSGHCQRRVKYEGKFFKKRCSRPLGLPL
ncbi:hypothetical protein CDD82_7927 [Ophiocordyceps australis]|uniref:Uncharacterized protein n=1 Tax=Ophiocordyceps australis TaxID=1399860 RepID=A0A2C5ZL25_9HYPO|nr:hypothetical protein CDD82_7927 [Ophiocordyceps australis]